MCADKLNVEVKHQKCLGATWVNFFIFLRLQLIVMVALSVVEVARLIIDGLEGAHAATVEGVKEQVLPQNGPWRTLRSIWSTLFGAEDRGKEEEKEHFEHLRCLYLLHQAHAGVIY